METRHTTDTTNASDTSQTMHGLDTEPDQELKEPKLLRWSKPAGDLPEFGEVSVELVDPAKRANRGTINTVPKAIAYVADILARSCVERAAIILINANGMPTGYSIVSIGSESHCCLSPAELARVCLLSGSARIILMHNHPACTYPHPSAGDNATAQGLFEILRQVGVILFDFIIVGTDSRFYSYRENRRTPFSFDATYTGWEKDNEEEENDTSDGPDDGQDQ